MCRFAPAPRDANKPTVGMVTALYRGRAHGAASRGSGLPSRLEALGIATDFMPGVLLSKMIEGGLHYGLGSTLAVRREALEKVGGLLSIVDHLADDYELGARVAQAGYRMELSAPKSSRLSVPAYELARILRSSVALAADCALLAPGRLCGADLHPRPRLGAAECAGQRIEPFESLAAGAELFPAAGAGHDGGRRGAGRSRGARRISGCCRCATLSRWACGWRALPGTPSCGAGSALR